MMLSIPPAAVGKKARCGSCRQIVDPATAQEVVAPVSVATTSAAVDFDLFEENAVASTGSATSPAAGTAARHAPADEGDDIPVTCRLCSTRYYATSRHIGRELKCPDCHTMNVVERTKAKTRPTLGIPEQRTPEGNALVDPMVESLSRHNPSGEEDAEFRLEAPSERPSADHFLLVTRPPNMPTPMPPTGAPPSGGPASVGPVPTPIHPIDPNAPRVMRSLPVPSSPPRPAAQTPLVPPAIPTYGVPAAAPQPPPTPVSAPVRPKPKSNDPYDLEAMVESLPSTGQAARAPQVSPSIAPATPVSPLPRSTPAPQRAPQTVGPSANPPTMRPIEPRAVGGPGPGAPLAAGGPAMATGRFQPDDVGEYDVSFDFSWMPGGLLVDRMVLARVVPVTLGMGIAFALFGFALSLSRTPNPIGNFAILVCNGMGGLVLAISAVQLASVCFTVCEATANGQKKFDDWPHSGFVEAVQHAFFIAAGVFYAGVPGAALFAALNAIGFSEYLVLLVWPCAWVFFPIAYLSMLESGSITRPFGRTVFASVSRRTGRWISLYIDSAISMTIMTGALYAAFHFGWTIGFFLAGIVVACVPVLYFQRLGRMALSLNALRDAMEEEEATRPEEVRRPSY